MISRVLVILVIISSFPILSTLQLPTKVMAQVPPSEGAKVLVDDVIQALKVNDTEKAQVHLSILNQQLPTFVNSISLQSVKVLLDDVTSALKNKNVNSALIHLNLVKQQLGFANNLSNSTESIGRPQVKIKSNHPPVAYDDNVTVTSGSEVHIKLRAIDSDGDPIKFSINDTTTSFGILKDLNANIGDVTYEPATTGAQKGTYLASQQCDTCTDTFTFHATDSHNATSNTGYYQVKINPQSSTSNAETTTPPETAAPPESSVLPSPSEEPSQNIAPPVNNENPSNTGTDYSSICAKLQPVLIQPCSTLVSADGSLTSEGTHALNCIKNGILLGGGAAVVGVPLPIILKGLSILAAPTGCGDVVNMKGFEQLGDIGSLSSITSLLP
jgi:Big-like domain-containing protein